MDVLLHTPSADNNGAARRKSTPTLLEQAVERLSQVEEVLLALVENTTTVDDLLLDHQAGRLRGEFAPNDATGVMARNPLEHPEAAFRRGYMRGMNELGAALRDADLIDRKTLGKVADFIFGPISRWRRDDPRLSRRLHADRAPKLEFKRMDRVK
jgi:hypothetical protein